jgi:hypothetical protein
MRASGRWAGMGACNCVLHRGSLWCAGTSFSWGVIEDAVVLEGVGYLATLSFVSPLITGLISALAIINACLILWLGSYRTAILAVLVLGQST